MEEIEIKIYLLESFSFDNCASSKFQRLEINNPGINILRTYVETFKGNQFNYIQLTFG